MYIYTVMFNNTGGQAHTLRLPLTPPGGPSHQRIDTEVHPRGGGIEPPPPPFRII